MLKVGIVCGCLPTQFGIESSDLYHQVLNKKLKEVCKEEMEVVSTWYTTLAESGSKALELLENAKPDILFYHIRPDPYLRASKLFLRYRDLHNIFKNKLNLLADDSMIFDPDDNNRLSPLRKKRKKRGLIFRNLNYFAGYLMGVNYLAGKKQRKEITRLLAFAESKKTGIIILGPASRPRSWIENFLLQKLETKMAVVFKDQIYITCFGSKGKNGETLFMEDGVHLSKAGHFRFSELLFPAVKEYLKIKKAC